MSPEIESSDKFSALSVVIRFWFVKCCGLSLASVALCRVYEEKRGTN